MNLGLGHTQVHVLHSIGFFSILETIWALRVWLLNRWFWPQSVLKLDIKKKIEWYLSSFYLAISRGQWDGSGISNLGRLGVVKYILRNTHRKEHHYHFIIVFGACCNMFAFLFNHVCQEMMLAICFNIKTWGLWWFASIFATTSSTTLLFGVWHLYFWLVPFLLSVDS